MKPPKDSRNRAKDDKGKSTDSHAVASSTTQNNLAEKKTEKNTDYASDTNDKHNPSEETMGWWRRKWEFVIIPKHSNAVVAIFSALLFLATVFYTVFAALQWTTMKRQLTQMQDANRPYIFTIPMFAGQRPIEKFHSLKITIGEMNLGNSPATKETHSPSYIAVDSDSGIADKVSKCAFKYGPGSATLPVGNTSNGIGQTIGSVESRFITDEERDNYILTGKAHIIIFGGIKYSGTKGGEYETRYCYIWDPASASNLNILPWHTEC